MIVQERHGKIPSRVICVGDGECVVSFLLLALTIPRCRSFHFSSFCAPLDPFRAPRSPCPLRKVSRASSPFLEYNLQTPLNARSRFKAPGTRRALLYPSVKISRPASVPPSHNSCSHPFCIYLFSRTKFWQSAVCARAPDASFCRPAPRRPLRILQQFVSQLFRNRVVIKLLNALCSRNLR